MVKVPYNKSNKLLNLFLFSFCFLLCYNVASAQVLTRIPASKSSSSATEIFIRPKVDPAKKPSVAKDTKFELKEEVVQEKPPLKVEKPEMVPLVGGIFEMGVKGSKADDGPAHLTLVPSFEISKYPITNKQFAQFVKEIGYKTKAEKEPTELERKNNISWKTFAIPGRESYPVVWIAYEDAQAYCVWLSSVVNNPPIEEPLTAYSEGSEEENRIFVKKTNPYRLPTEAEWEYAARGGLKGQPYPWEKADTEKINYNANNRENTIKAAKLYIKAVGYQPANNFGVQDLVGNVGQWCYDWYDASFYEYSPTDTETNEPLKSYGPEVGTGRVIRGGSWLEDLGSCRVTSRQSAPESTRTAQVGFRIVRVIAPPKENSSKIKKNNQPQTIFCNFNYPFSSTYHTNMSLQSLILLERRRYFSKSSENQ